MVFINSDNLITLSALYNGGYINDATVTGLLIDRTTGETLHSYTLNHVSDSNGDYTGLIPESIADDLVEDQELRHVVTAESGGYVLQLTKSDLAGFAKLQ